MSKTRKRGKAYGGTTVAVSRSREQIDAILLKWGVAGIQWEDDYDIGRAQLRFRWKREDGVELVARIRVDLDSEDDLRELAVDQRNGQFSEKKFERVRADRGKREHRLLLNYLKNMFEAIEAGIIPAESLLIPWIEDATGMTVYEKIERNMHHLATKPLHEALAPGDDE